MASKLFDKLKPGSSLSDAESKPKKEDTKAMELMAKWAAKGKAKEFPPTLKDYLQNHPPLPARATKTVAGEFDYALKFKRGNIVVLPSGDVTVEGKEYQTFKPLLVPMVPRNPKVPGNPTSGKAAESFPQGKFAVLDLSNPPADRVIVTPKLSGCSFVVGIASNNVFYLGHVQPPESGGQQKPMGAELARYFKQADKNKVFDGVQVSKVEVFGADADGYGVEAEAAILGWVSDNKLFLAIRSSSTGLRIVTYPH